MMIVIKTMIAPVNPIGLAKIPRRHQTRFSLVRCSTTLASEEVGAVMPVLICSSLFDSRIEVGIQDVHHEIDEDEDHCQIEHSCLHERIVAIENRL